jgi:hypothetical protein
MLEHILSIKTNKAQNEVEVDQTRRDMPHAAATVLFWLSDFNLQPTESRVYDAAKKITELGDAIPEPTRRVLAILDYNQMNMMQLSNELEGIEYQSIQGLTNGHNVSRKLAVAINDLIAKKYVDGNVHRMKRADFKNPGPKDFFLPPDFEKMNFHAKPASTARHPYGPFERTDPRWQLMRLYEANGSNWRYLIKMIPRGFLEEFTNAMKDANNIKSTLVEKLNNLRLEKIGTPEFIQGDMSDYPEASLDTLFWPEDLNIIKTSSEYRALPPTEN